MCDKDKVDQFTDNLRWLQENGWEGWTEADAEQASDFVSNLQWLEENGSAGWTEDDAKQASDFVSNLRWLEENGCEGWTDEDAEQASDFVNNLRWLQENGWKEWSEEDLERVDALVENLQQLQRSGEQPTGQRIEELPESEEEAVYRRLYTCCPHSGCTAFQDGLSFLHSFEIESEMELDDDGHYFQFSLPKNWSLSDLRRFNEAIAQRLSSDKKPCDICGNVNYSEAVIAACRYCGEEYLICEECPLEDAAPCNCQE